MARRALSPAQLAVVRAVTDEWPGGAVVAGVSGGPDSTALALAASHVAAKVGGSGRAIVVDHGLQPGSADVARAVVAGLGERGIDAECVSVRVELGGDGLEAAARDARLAALARPGLPVLLGHTLDDQAEQVLLGLARGSGTRALAGMPARRGPFRRPLLGLRRTTTVRACADWGVQPWADPMNDDPAHLRVRARRALALLADELGRDLAPALARSATLARADADLLDELAAAGGPPGERLPVVELAGLPDALRRRRIKAWLADRAGPPSMVHVVAVDQLVTRWHGQGPVDVPGGRVRRCAGELELVG